MKESKNDQQKYNKCRWIGVEKRRRKAYLAGVLVRGPEAEDGLQSRGSLINGSSDQNLKQIIEE